MPNGKQKIVMVPGTGVVAFPGEMEDEHVAAAIRAFRSQKAADQASQSHPLNRPQPLMTEQSERQRHTKQAQPLSSAIPHLPAWLNTPSSELGRQAGNWLSGEIGKALGTTLPDISPNYGSDQAIEQFRQAHPIAGGVTHGISDIANGLTSPAGAALLMTAPESKVMSALFATQALHGAYKDAQAARRAYEQGNNEEATRYATESILGGAMGLAAGAHAVRPELGPQGEVLPPEAKPGPKFPVLGSPTPATLEGKTGSFALPEPDEAPIANYQLIYKSPSATPEEMNAAVQDLVKARQAPGWNDPNATDEEARQAQQDFYAAADRLGKLRQQSVGQIRQLPSGEKIVYLTHAGLQDLSAGLRGRAPDPEYSLNGVSISGRYIPIVQQNLSVLQTPHSDELNKLLAMGAGPDGTVTVSAIPDKNETLSNALSRLREEINYGWQKQFSDQTGNHLPSTEFRELNGSIPEAMSDYLARHGYNADDGSRESNRMRVLEASSKMMSGAPSEFGLTPDEVANYLFQYFEAVTRQHGPQALDQLVHTTTLARNIKRDYANARYPSRGSQGQGVVPGLPARGQGSPQAGAGAPGRGTAAVTGPPAAAPAATPSVDFSRTAIAKTPEEIAASTDWTNPPRSASTVDGLEVTSHIPNQSSIDSALDSPTVLPGIREIPLDKEWYAAPKDTFKSASDIARTHKLAEEIRNSGKIDPLIVAVEDGKPYILEGVHRLSALHLLGKKAFPAMVVLEGGPEMNQTRRTPESSPSGRYLFTGDEVSRVANEVHDRLEKEGYRVFPLRGGNVGGSRYLNVFPWGDNSPDAGVTLRFSTHRANIGGNYVSEYTGKSLDENDVGNYEQAIERLNAKGIKPKASPSPLSDLMEEAKRRAPAPTVPQSMEDMVGRRINTANAEDQDLGRAAHIEDGEIVAYHLTDHPEKVREYLESGKPLHEGGRAAEHDELGPGLYASDVPNYWMGRSTGKYAFLNNLTPEQGDKLADAIQDRIDNAGPGYLSKSEVETAHRYLDQFRKDRYGDVLTLLAGQPYNVDFWKPEFLKSIGVEPSKQPEAVEVRAKGNFAEVKNYLRPAEWKALKDAGFDGAWVRAGFSTEPQLVIWNRNAITKFGDWKPQREQPRHHRQLSLTH